MTDNIAIPQNASACLVLADGKVFFGESIGAGEHTIGEICFNTAMTGYQEVLTDPSYAGQIITFTFPHIGNVGCNDEDIEALKPACAGLVVRERITPPSSFRSKIHFNDWLKEKGISGISGVDTRALTRYIRKNGAQNAMIFRVQSSEFRVQLQEALEELKAFPSMKGLELAAAVSTTKILDWDKPLWQLAPAGKKPAASYRVVALDYGVKQNILRNLVEAGCEVIVVPSKTPASEILAHNPDGIFLSNGPGDPAATGQYSLPIIRELIDSGKPIFGICLGHQMLALALGAQTEKMAQGHRGANHPVKDLKTGLVSITSQNHGFAVSEKNLPADVEVTHVSLFDGTVQGIASKTKPIFGVQGHPEASPGPHDSQPLFAQFVAMMGKNSRQSPVVSRQQKEAI
ncbi:MAG: carbamoyl-phosphate synthase small subunit [Alphaproteobacteria bacterium]|nr:carbamoyl-phosphate synthase small subunit [Alphaproteobacteria bacterium]